MQTYSEFQPTGFDPRGAFLPDRQDWLVVPVSITRDTSEGGLSYSNFQVALEMLNGESETVQVHRFGHWGPGWFEIIIVDPNSEQAQIAHDIERALEDYPVLDEEDYSQRQWDTAQAYWDSMSLGERIEVCKRFDFSIFAARHEDIPLNDHDYEIVYYLAE